MFSTLAGFVEPGESLEEAVAREVLEETAVRVSSVRYVASQPWPFPASIMLGFRATAESFDITIDADELTEARWFTAAELRAAGEWGDASASLKLPRRDSIARQLVEGWLAEQA
jgi:NAD+ diphosphatase